MTIQEKQLRKYRRCEKRRNRTGRMVDKIVSIKREYELSFSQARNQVRYGHFTICGKDMQICSYEGICDHPCNGDC